MQQRQEVRVREFLPGKKIGEKSDYIFLQYFFISSRSIRILICLRILYSWLNNSSTESSTSSRCTRHLLSLRRHSPQATMHPSSRHFPVAPLQVVRQNRSAGWYSRPQKLHFIFSIFISPPSKYSSLFS